MAKRLKVNFRYQFECPPEDLLYPPEDAVECVLEYLMGVAELCDEEREDYAKDPAKGQLYGVWKSPRFEILDEELKSKSAAKAARSRFHELDAFQDASETLVYTMRTVPTGGHGPWPLDVYDIFRLKSDVSFDGDQDAADTLKCWLASLLKKAHWKHRRWHRGIKPKKDDGELVFEEGWEPEAERVPLDFDQPNWDLVTLDEDDMPEGGPAADTTRTALTGALRRLPSAMAELLWDHAAGNTVQAIADARGVSKRTLERQLQKAGKALGDTFVNDHPKLYHKPPGLQFTGVDPDEVTKAWPVRTMKDMTPAEVTAIHARLVHRLSPEERAKRQLGRKPFRTFWGEEISRRLGGFSENAPSAL
jgi:hypothetical protein